MDKLTTLQKQLIVEQVRALDPKGEILSLTPNETYTGGSIAYNLDSGIVLNEKINRLNDEEYVRAYLVVRLVKELRYPVHSLELERRYTIGRPSPTKAQIDVKVWDKRKGKPKTFMLIEAKRPDDYDSYTKFIEDQLFATGNQEYANGIRYTAWYSIEFLGDGFRDKCIVIDFRKNHDYRAWVEAGEPGHNFGLPVEYGVLRKQRYVKGQTPLRNDLNRIEFEALRRDFHNVLWGGAKMGDTDVFNNLLKMFLAKIYDELTTDDGQPYRFQIELKDGEPESPGEVVAKINRLYQDALGLYFGYSQDTLTTAIINENRFPPNKVNYVVEQLEGISIVENTYQDDILGTFFESIVRTGFKQEKGQFFTHTNIVRFILYALELDGWAIELINGNPPKLPYIIDSACGSGTFLLESMKLITQSVLHTNKGKLSKRDVVRNYVDEFFLPNSPNKNVHNKWARTFIYGIDDNEDLATATKVNMILHGDGNANILKADGLADFTKYALARMKVAQVHPNGPYGFPINEQFDCLISNPPFSLKEEARTLAEYGGRFAYVEQKNSENLFIERWYQLLKEGGRMGVVLPDSVFDTNENLYIRMFLYRLFWIRAVVSLPQVTFQPYTPTKTSLLFAVKKTRKEVEQWDDAWRKAAGQYKKLRESPVVTVVLKNERIRNSLADFAARIELEWYPSTNLLNQETLSPEIRKHFIDTCASNSRLVEKLKTMLQIYDEFVSQDIWSNFSERELDEARETLKRLLRGRLPLNTDTLSLCEFVEAVYDEIVLATELNYTQDPKGQPYCNAWWVFSELTTQKPFDYEVFFAEAENIGYKRTTRHPEGIPQPNDLFQTNADGNITIDTENPKKILDYLRSKKVFFCHDAEIGHFSEKVSSLCRDWFLRLDVDYVWIMRQFIPFLKNQKLKDVLLAVQTGRPITKADYADEPTGFIHIVVRNIRGGKLELTSPLYITEKKGNELRFYGLRQGDIVMAISSTCGHSFYLSEPPEEQLTLSHYTARLVSNTLKTNPQLLTYYINSPLAQSYFRAIETGKAQKNLSKININYLPLAIDCSDTVLLNKILAVEANVEVSLSKLRQPADIINEILCATFGYPLDEHQKRERERVFTRRVGHLGTGSTLRSSVKFHHPAYELTDTFFARVPHKRIKLYLATPIRLGITITREDMDDEGEAYYVHPNALRRQECIDLNDCHRIKMGFYEKNRRRANLRTGDVIINRSGEALGKIALFDLEEPCLFSDFTMRVRFAKTMNPYFAWYYFRSILFQSQIEREKRGMILPNIFPSQVEGLLVTDCTREQQDALAAQITAELDALEKEHEKIEAGRQEIQRLIKAAITKVKAV